MTYTCEGDAKVVVNVHAKEARIAFKGHTYNMKQIDEADGQKYSDGSVVWRNRGEEGTLERASKPGGEAKALASNCHIQTTGTNPSGKNPPTSHP